MLMASLHTCSSTSIMTNGTTLGCAIMPHTRGSMPQLPTFCTVIASTKPYTDTTPSIPGFFLYKEKSILNHSIVFTCLISYPLSHNQEQ